MFIIKIFKYFIQAIIIYLFFIIIKISGLNFSRKIFAFLFNKIGRFIKSEKIVNNNLEKFLGTQNIDIKKNIKNKMWNNYGKTFVEYLYLSKFRNENNHIEIRGEEILNKIKKNNKPVVFVSGHFANFELMSMELTKRNINLATIYRPLNNFFLNPFMEYIRKKYICRNQIKKGPSGTRQLLSLFKKGSSIALMIDQRVSQGIKSNFFGHEAFTTTIPAQFVKKFQCKVVPIYIERVHGVNFKLTINSPITFSEHQTIDSITLNLNSLLEKMILKNPGQWIWSHNRWK